MAFNMGIFITVCVIGTLVFEVSLADMNMTESVESTESVQTIRCPHRWLPGPDGGSCYRFWPESSKSWENARKTCHLYEAELLKLNSVEEKEFVIKEVVKYSVNNEWWIGLKRDPNDVDAWLWTDGTQRNENTSFLQWGFDEPNNFRGQEDCAEIWDNLLNDKNCRQLLQFICERPKGTPSMCDVDNGWDNHGSSQCYKFFDEDLTIQEARFKCFDNDADILVITGEQDQELLTDFIRHENKSSTWLKLSLQQTSLTNETGGKDEFQWSWGLSGQLESAWWQSGEPNKDGDQDNGRPCSVMVSNTTGYNNWHPANCSEKHNVMCMKSKGSCPDGYRKNDGRCYTVHFNEPMRWIDAKSHCNLRATELLEVRSESQRDFVMTLLKTRGNEKTKVWIALKGSTPNLVWDSGEALGIYEQTQLADINGTGCIYMTIDGQWGLADCAENALPMCSLPENHPVIPMKPTTTSRYACPVNYIGPVDGYCYRLHEELQLDWASARHACQAEGTDLAVFPTLETYLYVQERIQQSMLIGLNDRFREGKHIWLDEQKSVIGPFWKSLALLSNISIGGMYSENCMAMYNHPDHQNLQNKGSWFDVPCILKYPFICSKKGDYNIAIGKQMLRFPEPDPNLSMLNDGQTDIIAQQCYIIPGSTTEYYGLDLGASYPIQKIGLFAQYQCPFCPFYNVTVYIGDTFCHNKTCIVETESHWEDFKCFIITLPKQVNGRYVTLDFANKYPRPICEVQVFEDNSKAVTGKQGATTESDDCSTGWVEDSSGICYFKSHEQLNWADADVTCQSMQATLAIPADPVADSFLTEIFKGTLTDMQSVAEVWLGASLYDRQVGWETVLPSQKLKNSLDTLTHGQSDTDQTLCALFYLDNTLNQGILKANGCLDRKPYVCQYPTSTIKLETKDPDTHTSLQNLGRKVQLQNSAVKFQIKGSSGAKIQLNINTNILELKLCDHNNKKSSLFINGESVKTYWKDLCSVADYTPFYISWGKGQVGKGDKIGENVFMTWDAESEQEEFVHVFVSSLTTDSVFWKFEQDMKMDKHEENPFLDEVNVAFGKMTKQSSFLTDLTASNIAVDGCETARYGYYGCCSQTKSEMSPFWEVDLAQSYAIKEIIIYRRTCCHDNIYERLYGFTMTLIRTDRAGLQHKEKVYQQKQGYIPEVIKVPTPGKTAQIVRIEIPGRQETLELCKVKVIQDVDREDCGSDDWHAVKVDGKIVCVYLSNMTLSWIHAQEFCKDHGSVLGFPDSPQLQLFLYDYNGKEAGQCIAFGLLNKNTNWNTIPCSNENIFFCKDNELTTTAAPTTTTVLSTTSETTTIEQRVNVSCDSGWVGNTRNHACYKVVLADNLDFYAANLECLKMGARLSDIADTEEQDFLKRQMELDVNRPTGSIGSWDVLLVASIELAEEGDWSWFLYDTPWNSEVRWSPGQPDNFQQIEDCAGLRLHTSNLGELNDLPCSHEAARGYICKKASEENLCPENWFFNAVNNGCYSISYGTVSWPQAEKLCESSGGMMTSITSQLELNFINAIQESAGKYWVGATYSSGDDWFSFLLRSSRWSGLEVDIDPSLNLKGLNWKLCGIIDGGKMLLTDCQQRLGFICKYTGFKTPGTTPIISLNATTPIGQTDTPGGGSSIVTTKRAIFTSPPTTSPSTAYVDSLCGSGWERNPQSDGVCYMFSAERITWDEARSICAENAGDLVSIQTMAEQHYLTGRLSGLPSIPVNMWIGASNLDLEGGWKWTDGSPFAYFNWKPLQPDDFFSIDKTNPSKGCGALSTGTSLTYFGKWDDRACDDKCGYICKKVVRQREVTTVAPVVTSSDEYYGCPEIGWLGYGQSCFLIVQEKKDWRAARDYCQKEGGDLASIANQHEQDYVFSQLPQDSYCFNIWTNDTQCTTWAEQGECDHNPVWMAKHCHLACKKCMHNCRDKYHSYKCTEWALDGECEKNPKWMIPNCAQSCGVCEGAPTRGFWIGLLRKPYTRSYEWSDHTDMQYTIWSHRQPTDFRKPGQSCGAMFLQTGKWNDGDCSVDLPGFVCKQKMQLLAKSTQSENKEGCAQRNSYGYGPYCYSYEQNPKTWDDAEQDCVKQGGSLAVIEDVYVQSFVASEIATMVLDFWIGLSLTNHSLSWSNGNDVTFTHFDRKFSGVSQLYNSCFAMKNYLGTWEPYDCATTLPYICRTMRDGYTTPTSTQTPPTTTSLPPCPDNWLTFNSHCYIIFDEQKGWFQAEEYCSFFGASLASVHNLAENEFIHNQAFLLSTDKSSLYIGLNDRDTEGIFVWTDGSPYVYDEWYYDEPNDAGGNEDCVEMTLAIGAGDWNWNDVNCFGQRRFICKIEQGKPLLNYGSTPKPKQEACDGDPDWLSFGGDYCYYFENAAFRNWFDANDECVQRGGHLASIHSQEEQHELATLTNGADHVIWIGYNRLSWDNRYQWSDGSQVDFTHWSPSQPNDNQVGEKCAVIDNRAGDWHDYNCNDEKAYLCKKHKAWVTSPTTQPPPPIEGGCPTSYIPFGNKCYYFNGGFEEEGGPYTFRQARDKCVEKGADLVSIHSPLEQAFLVSKSIGLGEKNLYVGLVDLRDKRKFDWLDNSRVDYTNWNIDEPSSVFSYAKEECVEMCTSGNVGTWNDIPCYKLRGFICSKLKDPSLPNQEEPVDSEGCPSENYRKYNDKCYKLNKMATTWDDSAALCEQDRATLVTIKTVFEQAFIDVLTDDSEMKIWINGKVDPLNGFEWTNGEDVQLNRFVYDEYLHEKSCVFSNNSGWYSQSCMTELPSICEFQPVNEPQTSPVIEDVYRCRDPTWLMIHQDCYVAVQDQVPFLNAHTECKSRGMDMVSIHDFIRNMHLIIFLRSHQKNSQIQHYWIGLYRYSDQDLWYWSDNSEYTFSNFGADSKSSYGLEKACAYLTTEDLYWHQSDCFSAKGYVCKGKADFVPLTSTVSGATSSTVEASEVTSSTPSTTMISTSSSNMTAVKVSTSSSTRNLPPYDGTRAPLMLAKEEESLSGGEIAGIVFGVFFALVIAGVCVYVIYTLIVKKMKYGVSKNSLGFDNALFHKTDETVSIDG